MLALRRHIAVWRAIGAPNNVLSSIWSGVKLRFAAIPPMMPYENDPGGVAHPSFIDEEVKKRVESGQMVEIAEKEVHRLLPIDVTPKSNGKLRLIVDCRLINSFLPDISFKLENLSTVPQVVRKGDWLFSIDLT